MWITWAKAIKADGEIFHDQCSIDLNLESDFTEFALCSPHRAADEHDGQQI